MRKQICNMPKRKSPDNHSSHENSDHNHELCDSSCNRTTICDRQFISQHALTMHIYQQRKPGVIKRCGPGLDKLLPTNGTDTEDSTVRHCKYDNGIGIQDANDDTISCNTFGSDP